MIGRRSIWSQPEVIELARQFVTTTDEVWRLQNGTDPECRHFQKIADVGHYRKHRSTRQGIYASTASGVLLGSLNSHNVESVVTMMQSALDQYRAMDRQERLLPADSDIQATHRWEDSYPENGLHLTMTTRDLPESGQPADPPTADWNQDRVWFSRAEAERFLPSSREQWRHGVEYEIPRELVRRFARFSIVDTIRGQTSYYSPEEVDQSSISAQITHVTSGQVQIEFQGATLASSGTSRGRDMPHGIQTQLLGAAVWDLAENRFTTFDLVAIGERWGRTVFNGRRDQLERSPAGFVFRLTDPESPRIAPSFLFAYRADWIKWP